MMKKEILNNFLNKVIKLRLKNGYFYQGVLLEVGNDFIKLNDRYDGNIFIDISEVNSVRLSND